MRRAQAAMEFLMTYGWALLAALAGIGALTYFGVFSLDNSFPEKCLFSQGIDCVEFIGVRSGVQDNVTLYIKNNIGEGITIYALNLTGEGQKRACSPTPVDMAMENKSAFLCQFSAFNKKQVKLQGLIIYSKATGEYNHTTTGDINVKIQG